MLLDLVGIASESEKVSTNSEGIIEVGGAGPAAAGESVVWMDQRQHVLLRPDMYVGPTGVCEVSADVLVQTGSVLGRERVTAQCSPALLKFMDEAITNAIDNQRTSAAQRCIRVTVEPGGVLCVSNDGDSVPVREHSSGLWVPTVVFSEFLSGTNFDDSEARFTGGRNGVGIKATNTWSKWFEVDIADARVGLRFKQRFEDNMAVRRDPVLSKMARKGSSTSVRWLPDYERLGMGGVARDGLDDGVRRLLEARAYDACVCTGSRVAVYLNGERLGLRTLQQYTRAMGVDPAAVAHDSVPSATSAGASTAPAQAPAGAGDEVLLEVVVAARADPAAGREPHVAAFVNGVRCSAGTHVDLITRRVVEIVTAKARARAKDPLLPVRPQHVRQELTIIASVLVPNPRFASQSKECLDTAVRNFGFTWDPSPAFRAAIERLPLVDRVLEHARDAEARQLQKGPKPSLRTTPRIDKYDPATALFKGEECTLTVTEGDSAKALAVAGLSVVGRRRFGVFPLRGKLMNVTKFSARKVLKNAEISNLMLILGLRFAQVHDAKSVAALPYHRLAIFADQDHDGRRPRHELPARAPPRAARAAPRLCPPLRHAHRARLGMRRPSGILLAAGV